MSFCRLVGVRASAWIYAVLIPVTETVSSVELWKFYSKWSHLFDCVMPFTDSVYTMYEFVNLLELCFADLAKRT